MGKLDFNFIRPWLLPVILIILFGCSDNSPSNSIGSPISNREIVPIAALFDNASKYDGKRVTVKGVVAMQDQRGYWFYIEDEEARIYVDLSEAGFSIPELTKRTALAEGSIEVKANIPSLLATGVEPQ